MSQESGSHDKHEIIIVKRGGGGHGGHHGGAWKIAYADFMTAMMAFFLVMWLVNAANEETTTTVASYFNPIQLTEQKPTERGLKKPTSQAEGEEERDKSKSKENEDQSGNTPEKGQDQSASAGESVAYSQADYFENPYAVLAEIAQEVGQQANVSAKGDGGASDSGPATGANGGEAYRDPFDPDFWTKQVEVSRADQTPVQVTDETKKAAEDKAQEMAALHAGDTEAKGGAADGTGMLDGDKKPGDAEQGMTGKAQGGQMPDKAGDAEGAKAATGAQQDRQTPALDHPMTAEQKAKLEKEAADIRFELQAQLQGTAGKLAEGLVVTPAEGGVLVSLSDQSGAPMFNVGSAVPQRDMVLAMEKIGKVLQERKGRIVIRGHTDGRPFAEGTGDNWQLSMDRAHSAYFMLVRGGLDEKRVEQVSGFADRRLEVPSDPLADANRRIEILIEGGQG
ncbi:MotB family protein [Rhizobium sp. NRK18]|uniref:MotB family protein n=1 Tax=Rhizobium sp. NRK18 TaxID=2964667 RepID=UPI0021C2B161|nr:MotB family protein [Rhizobium sp. NRK18]MCQ2005329.1 MotB family protein [Rhizobium sp. NRK18]